jgi:predicted alpha-1,2-mannosidase
LVSACTAAASGDIASADLARHVNRFIGTDGTGHVFPGATRPFGMVAPSPDNARGGWDYTSGYQYRAPRILGFSNTHISGAGIPDLGDVLLQPRQVSPGRRWTSASRDFSSRYDKRSEAASPGHYAVTLKDLGVQVDLTATQRVALQRYTFQQGGAVQVLVDLQHGLQYGEQPRVTASEVARDAAAGEVSGTVHIKGWTERQASFVLRFDQPIRQVRELPLRPGDRAPRLLLDFQLPAGRKVLLARVALSTVDVPGARGNLAIDIDLPFDTVRREARAEWNALLTRATIQAPPRQQRIFHSALYRVFMHPSDIADADGRVRGPTGEVIQVPGGRYYSTLSLWDTFRAVQPLFTLLVPERVAGMVGTLLLHQQAQGYLPLWTAWGRETHTMIGNPALPVIADALAKGFGGIDREQALRAMLATVTVARPQAPAWAQHDWSAMDRWGYVPFDQVSNESVSLTLEYGIGDDAVARVARAVGDPSSAERFARRAQGYRLLWDADSHMMRGKDSQGAWRRPFDPLKPTSPLNNPGDYTEANAWQYTLTPALHDPQGLVHVMGGPAAFERWLDRFFSVQAPGRQAQTSKHLGQEALIGQYAHGNEPSHHIAYLYAWTPSPWKGHALIRRIVDDFYGDGPAGITGNDDCGQMSAWYVLSTLGLYPVQPASGQYVLGAPQVAAAELQLAGGARLQLRADGFSARRPWAASAMLNGQALDALAVPHAALAAGGELRFTMRALPQAWRPQVERR